MLEEKRKNTKFHAGQPSATLVIFGLLQRSVIRHPVVTTYLLKNNTELTLVELSKMENECKSTICILLGVLK